MKKIAILTLVINNYGTKLQSYALCKAIKSFGLMVPEVIKLSDAWGYGNVAKSRKKQLIDVFKTYKLKSFKKILEFVSWNLQYKDIRKNIASFAGAVEKQNDLYQDFDNYIPYTKKLYSIEDIRGGLLNNDYHTFIVGSDQVWNGPRVGCIDVYMCDFLHNKRNALSYAASFAINDIPDNLLEDYKKYIQNMDTLLVREEQGVELCKQLGRNDAKHVVDPTLLLEEKDYEDLIKNPEELVGSVDFILVYSLNSSLKIYDEAFKLAERNHCKMVMLKRGAHPPVASKYKNSIDLIEVGPSEFLGLVKYAKGIVTGSYHALMFSLLFHTNFYIYLDDANAENSRLLSTLKMFGLEKQLYYQTSALPKQLPIVDFSNADLVLKKKREESLKLLRESIEKKL